MPPTLIYILALWAYIVCALGAWSVAAALALSKRTRSLAKKIATGMAGSFPGVFFFQLLSVPPVVTVWLLIGAVFWIFHPAELGAVILLVSLVLFSFSLVAAASLLGFYAGWRAAWELASGRSVRAFFVTDRLLGPAVRFMRKRLPILERVL